MPVTSPLPPGFPLQPAHPERICWGCDRLCPARDMACGTEIERGMHPIELFGRDWHEPEAASTASSSTCRSTHTACADA